MLDLYRLLSARVIFFLHFLLILPGLMCAEEFDQILFETENTPSLNYPFSLGGEYFSVNKTHFYTPGFEEDTLIYRQWDMAYAYTHPINPYCGLIFGAGWVGTEVDMHNNPDFNETLFNYVNLSLGGYTRAYDEWMWTATIAAFFDSALLSLIDYTLYQGVLWGKYTMSPTFEWDFGFLTEIGLSKTKVWPILGFIYTPFKGLRFNMVYPIDISIEYECLSCLTLAGSLRFMRNRHRVDKDEPNSQGIFEYKDTGAECDITYSPFDCLSLKGFLGSTFKGDLKITNRNNENAQHFKFNGSFYAGATANIHF